MSVLRKAGRGVIGIGGGILWLAFLSLVLQYLPRWGTQESLYVIVYLGLAILTLGGVVLALSPRARTAEFLSLGVATLGLGVGVAGAYEYFTSTGPIKFYMMFMTLIGVGAVLAISKGFDIMEGRLGGEDSA